MNNTVRDELIPKKFFSGQLNNTTYSTHLWVPSEKMKNQVFHNKKLQQLKEAGLRSELQLLQKKCKEEKMQIARIRKQNQIKKERKGRSDKSCMNRSGKGLKSNKTLEQIKGVKEERGEMKEYHLQMKKLRKNLNDVKEQEKELEEVIKQQERAIKMLQEYVQGMGSQNSEKKKIVWRSKQIKRKPFFTDQTHSFL